MHQPKEIDFNIEPKFNQEAVIRVAKSPHSALQVISQLLEKLKCQTQKQYELQQKYDRLLDSYFDVNEAYLATLHLLQMRDRSSKDRL